MSSLQMCDFFCEQGQEQIFPGFCLFVISLQETHFTAPDSGPWDVLQPEPYSDHQPSGEGHHLDQRHYNDHKCCPCSDPNDFDQSQLLRLISKIKGEGDEEERRRRNSRDAQVLKHSYDVISIL